MQDLIITGQAEPHAPIGSGRHGEGDDALIEVVGIADADMQGANVLWLF